MNMTAFLLLVMFAEPVAVQDAAGAAEQPQTERKICKRDYASESRLGSKRICKTAKEWKAQQGSGADINSLERAQRSN